MCALTGSQEGGDLVDLPALFRNTLSGSRPHPYHVPSCLLLL